MKRAGSLSLRALQRVSKALPLMCLLLRGPRMLGMDRGEFPLHGGDGGRPRLLEESLCRLEHSKSGDRG